MVPSSTAATFAFRPVLYGAATSSRPTPGGSWFTEQCHLSAKKELASAREDY
ncbi:hypothetical protein ABZV75_37790 [Streptomyces flaveolus]|uniref:hypothetical protein n=1 Tax=Streptomyces flaveolus TaxID=67297 RepID=UPI0033A7D51E